MPASPALRALLNYLAGACELTDSAWNGWRIHRIGGGWNNLLYHARGHAGSDAGDYAVKFTIRDPRDRASRELGALLALQQAGLSIAPQPILLDRDSYAQPVVVQTWLSGDVSSALPASDAEWLSLLQHLATTHTVTPGQVSVQLPRAVNHPTMAAEALAFAHEQFARVPTPEQSARVQALMRQIDSAPVAQWPAPALRLCHADPSLLNVIRRSGAWASVDWENAGWGDPAFEIADLLSHPACLGIPGPRKEWIVATYCQLTGAGDMAVRIATYRRLLLVWWAARCQRYLYEIPQGRDQRLATLPANWLSDMQSRLAHYLDLAEAGFTTSPD